MIQMIDRLPVNIARLRSEGEVTKGDFKHVLVIVVEKLLNDLSNINILLVHDNALSNFTFGTFLQDGILGLKHLTKWNRAAIGSDSEGISKLATVFRIIAPSEFMGFVKEDLTEAMA